MRTFFVTIFLLLSIVGNAQYYKLEYKVNFGFSVDDWSRYYNHMYYTTLNDPTPRELDDFYMYQTTKDDHLVQNPFSIPISASDGPITRIWVRSGRQHYRGIFSWWDKFCEIPDDPKKKPIHEGTTIYQNPGSTASTVAHKFTYLDVGRLGWGCLGEYDYYDWGAAKYRTGPVPITVDYFNLTPDLTITSPGNDMDRMIPIDDNIKLQATAGFNPELYKWQWFYTTWNSMPASCQKQSSFDINAGDLFRSSAEAESHIGENLKFRINYGGGYYSETLTLTIRPASPHIIKVDPVQPTCYGDKNGSAKIYFDRALYPSESLNITVTDSKGVDLVGKYGISSLEAGNSIKLDNNLGAGQDTIKLIGLYKGIPDYTGGAGHKYTFTIPSPDPLGFTAMKNDVLCHGNNDGAIKVTATGGTPNYKISYKKSIDLSWQDFNTSNTYIISGLEPATYNVKVIDANNCEGKNTKNEIVETITINQPDTLIIENREIKEPLGYGRTDGKIIVRVKGGTKKADSSYNVTWRKEDGTILTTVKDSIWTGGYQSVLEKIGKGKYSVTITDDNFTKTASGSTCMVFDTFTVNEPPPIIINIVQQNYILCKGNATGELAAHVTGGVPYTTGPTIPYKYRWFKREATDIDLGKTDSIASNLVAGNYVLKVTDKNGIEKISDPFTITEPDSLKVHFNITVNSCKATENISAIITGGTAPYHIEWPTGDTTITINDVPETLCSKNPCMVRVTDMYSCEILTPLELIISGTITIDTAIIQNPSYYGSKDGSIQITVSKGVPPYTYRWSNGDTTKNIQNLAAGTYNLHITDDSGCIKTQTFIIQNPPRIIQTGGTPLPNGTTTKTLCNGQHLDVDATISDNTATYQWSSSNGFTANLAKVTLTDTGEYWIKVTDSRGVTASDTLIIKRSNADINARVLVSTQAFTGEKLVFVNNSRPAPERIEWIIPNNPKIEVVQSNQNLAELIFKEPGTYNISMKSHVGDCEEIITKKIIIIQGKSFDDIGVTQNPFIKEFTIMPNPNTGQFNVKVVLQEQAKIKLRMMNVATGAVINDQELSGSSQYLIPYTISVASGTYILLLETPKGSLIQKVITN